MKSPIRIGTRDSQLAVYQAAEVKKRLKQHGCEATLVYIKSEGDIDLKTPLYEMGVQGIFTRSLDAALLNKRIDLAVHSMKDVPTQLASGVAPAAVLERGSPKDLLVWKSDRKKLEALGFVNNEWLSGGSFGQQEMSIATGSVRRKAQWLNRYPSAQISNMRGNVNTRLRKLHEANWDGAVFAAAGLERINRRLENTIELDWMLPAPAQGAILVACREEDVFSFRAAAKLNDEDTAFCTKIERDFLRTLLGGCSTPIGAHAVREGDAIHFKGNILSLDGKEKAAIEMTQKIHEAARLGISAAEEILRNGGQAIAESIRR